MTEKKCFFMKIDLMLGSHSYNVSDSARITIASLWQYGREN